MVTCEQRPGGSESCRNPGQRDGSAEALGMDVLVCSGNGRTQRGGGREEMRHRGMGQVLPGLQGCHQAYGWPSE